MTTLLRWGRSDYETAEDLALEARLLAEDGVTTRHAIGPPPDLRGVEVLVTTSKVKVTEAVLAHADDLRLIITTTSGHEHIHLPAAQARGITVARCPLARRDAVIETSLAMGLSLLRDLPTLQARAEAGIWARAELPQRPMRRLSGLVVGVVGAGIIGEKAAASWRALGADVLVCDPRLPDGVSLETLFAEAELITLHCALTPSSRHLINAETLRRLKPGVILLNTARGECVDVDALLAAPPLGGLGLDVFPEEPFPRLAELAARPNTWLLPHAAGFYQGLGRAVAEELAASVGAFLRTGWPHHVVTDDE
jgi:phosphoglycerate dehydrogenase-like enzyme